MSEGQVAVVVGVGAGLGAALGRRFANAGMAIALAARSDATAGPLAAEINDSGGSARAYATDSSEEAAVESLFSQVESDLGAPDLVVFNTGSYDLNASVDNSGNLLSGGTFTLMGDISDGNGLQTLLAGNLTDMGFVAPTNNTEELLLEFIIDVTSAPVNALYNYGSTAGIIFSSKITSGATLPDVWSAGFFNSSNGKADDFKLSAVAATAPGGATLAMLAIGMASLVRLRRQ